MLHIHVRFGFFAFALGVVLFIGASPSAKSQPEQAPAALKGLEKIQEPPVWTPKSAGKGINSSMLMDTRMSDFSIWDPNTRRADRVRLRSYYMPMNTPIHPMGGTISLSPGTTLNLRFTNRLPPNEDLHCHGGGGRDVNIPHCFNSTNLHTHGLWIDPSGNSDNVLLNIEPGQVQQYQFNVPADHPSGTFWYHAHLHGSTALQVSSGLAGPLIIRGMRQPTPATHGDIDTLLAPRSMEHIVLLQQIQYYCRDARGQIKKNPDGSYLCEPNDVGGIDGYEEFGPARWASSGRYTTINGQVNPWFPGRTGRLERWRIIHAGVRDTVNLRIARLRQGAGSPAALNTKEQQAYADQNCDGSVPMFLVAADGLTMGQVKRVNQAVFQPGYRWDILTYFQEPGYYCILDDAMPPGSNVARQGHSRRLIGMVWVMGEPIAGDPTNLVRDLLVDSARVNIVPDMRQKVINDLNNGLRLTEFTPHPDVTDSELDGKTQNVVYNIENPLGPNSSFQIDGRSFNPHEAPRLLPLGAAEEWVLKSDFAGHPHHIHVNPFQILRIVDPNGRDVSLDGAVDDAGGGNDPQYPGLKGVWKDTIWIKNPSPGTAPDPNRTYTVYVRTRYERYTGVFVIHCHILDHEDQGMMELEEIVPKGQISAALKDASMVDPSTTKHDSFVPGH